MERSRLLQIVSKEMHGVPIVYLRGVFEPRDTEAFRRYLFDLADRIVDDRLIIDLANLNHACSGILRVLVLVQRKLAMLDGRLMIAGARGNVREILQLTQVDNLLEITPSATDAASRLKAPAT